FDTLLAVDSYKIYGEVRGVGQLIRSQGVSDLIDPIMKLAAPPKEFRTLVKWLNAHSEEVITSRMLFASWPTRTKLPQFICAIEFPSAEEAAKFEPQLRAFLPKVVPTPTPSPQASPDPNTRKSATDSSPQKTSEPAALPYLIKHSGTLVLISDSPFTFRSLRPTGSKLLGEKQSFRLVRDRFASESVFLYVDLELEDRSNPTQSPSPSITIAAETNERQRPEEIPEAVRVEPSTPAPEIIDQKERPKDSAQATISGTSRQLETDVVTTSSEPQQSSPSPNIAFMNLSRVLMGGRPAWPEAFGAALVFEADSYVIRTLLINSPEKKGIIVPFFPQLVSGPALVPAAPSILPADTEFLVTASLDYAQIYDGALKTMQSEFEEVRRRARQPVKETQPESPFAAYERMLGISFKEELIPLLGNEIAVSMPMKAFIGAPPPPPPKEPAAEGSKTEPPATVSPVVAIAIKDREAVRQLIPKLIDKLGFKGTSLIAQTERRDDTELVSYAGVLAYAFIGDFLIGSPDAAAVRHVVDSYLNHETLASDSHFRNSTRWQPRQVLGQVYVSPALMDSYNSFARSMTGNETNQKMMEF
ncbi:MAG: DUF3352 domain-containing protein, partial [Pyrinomonadaceae bacterium]